MAHIFVRNSLNNKLAVKLNVTFPQYTVIGYEGDKRWLLEVATTYPSSSGTAIPPYYIDTLGPNDNFDDLMEDAVSDIASQIDWEPLIQDNDKPFVDSVVPADNTTVSIESNVYIDIKDDVPSAGIDLSGAVVTLNNGTMDFDITTQCEIEGDPFYYTIKWKPSSREYRTYDEE